MLYIYYHHKSQGTHLNVTGIGLKNEWKYGGSCVPKMFLLYFI